MKITKQLVLFFALTFITCQYAESTEDVALATLEENQESLSQLNIEALSSIENDSISLIESPIIAASDASSISSSQSEVSKVKTGKPVLSSSNYETTSAPVHNTYYATESQATITSYRVDDANPVFVNSAPIVENHAPLITPTVAEDVASIDGQGPDGPFTINAEVLFLKPGIEQSSYVISSSANAAGGEFFPSGRRHHNHGSYKPGFRIEGIYDPCCTNTLSARFTYFNAGHSSRKFGNFLFDTIGFPGDGAQAPEDINYSGRARLHDRYRYYAIDATFNRLSLCSCIDNLYLVFGLHYANIRHKANFRSFGIFPDGSVVSPVNNFLKSNSHFWGIGPQLGLDYTYTLPTCYGQFALNADMRAALLCSKTHANFHYNTLRTAGTLGVNLRNDSVWRVNPVFDARFSGSYHLCLCGYDTTVEVGYEWIWYNNAVDSITGYDVAFAGDSIDYFSNFSLHGPFIRLGISF